MSDIPRPEWWPSAWEPMNGPDFFLLGFTLVHHILVLSVVLHLVLKRNWPPYVTKNVTLVAATGVGSSFSIVGGLIAYGAWRREEGDFLAQCGAETVLLAVGVTLQFFPAFVRVYRNYKLLIWHSASMWSTMVQLQLVSFPYLVLALLYAFDSSLCDFETLRNRSFSNTWINLASFFYLAAAISCAIVLVVRMKRVRKQLNESTMMTVSLAFLFIWVLYLNPAGQHQWADRPSVARRLVMVDNFVSTVVLFWCPIFVPFFKYLQKDHEYVSQFTFGFSMLPTPAQMRASLADQLGVEDLRLKFRKYAEGRVAPELPDFYKACMDREQVEGYFERQAATMAIVDRFVAEGAEQEINISEECRERVLTSAVTRYNIFDEAIAEVLNIMEVNFKADFERTSSFRDLNRAVQREARELQVLRQARLVATPLKGEEGSGWWPHPPGFNNPYTRQMESQEVVASPGVSQRDLDVDEEAGLAVGGGSGDERKEEDDEAWMVPSPEGGGHARHKSGPEWARDGEEKQATPPRGEGGGESVRPQPGLSRAPCHSSVGSDGNDNGDGEPWMKRSPGRTRLGRVGREENHVAGAEDGGEGRGGGGGGGGGGSARSVVHTSYLRELDAQNGSPYMTSPELSSSPYLAPSPDQASPEAFGGGGRRDRDAEVAALAPPPGGGVAKVSPFFTATPPRGRGRRDSAELDTGFGSSSVSGSGSGSKNKRPALAAGQRQPRRRDLDLEAGGEVSGKRLITPPRRWLRQQRKDEDQRQMPSTTVPAYSRQDDDGDGDDEDENEEDRRRRQAGGEGGRPNSGAEHAAAAAAAARPPAAGGGAREQSTAGREAQDRNTSVATTVAMGTSESSDGGDRDSLTHGAGEQRASAWKASEFAFAASSTSTVVGTPAVVSTPTAKTPLFELARQLNPKSKPSPRFVSPSRVASFFGGSPWRWKRPKRVGGVESFSDSMGGGSGSADDSPYAGADAAGAVGTAAGSTTPSPTTTATAPASTAGWAPRAAAPAAVASKGSGNDTFDHRKQVPPPPSRDEVVVEPLAPGTPPDTDRPKVTSSSPVQPQLRRTADHSPPDKANGGDNTGAGTSVAGETVADDGGGGSSGSGDRTSSSPGLRPAVFATKEGKQEAFDACVDGGRGSRRRAVSSPLENRSESRLALKGTGVEAGAETEERLAPLPSPPAPRLGDFARSSLTNTSSNTTINTMVSSLKSDSSGYFNQLRSFSALVAGGGIQDKTVDGSLLSSIPPAVSEMDVPAEDTSLKPASLRVHGHHAEADSTGSKPAGDGRAERSSRGLSLSLAAASSAGLGDTAGPPVVPRGVKAEALAISSEGNPTTVWPSPNSSRGKLKEAVVTTTTGSAYPGLGSVYGAADSAGGGGGGGEGVAHASAKKSTHTTPAKARGGRGSNAVDAAAAAAAADADIAAAIAAASEVDPIVSPSKPAGDVPSPVEVVVSNRKRGAGSGNAGSSRWSEYSASSSASSVSSLSVLPAVARRGGADAATALFATAVSGGSSSSGGGSFERGIGPPQPSFPSMSSLSELPGAAAAPRQQSRGSGHGVFAWLRLRSMSSLSELPGAAAAPDRRSSGSGHGGFARDIGGQSLPPAMMAVNRAASASASASSVASVSTAAQTSDRGGENSAMSCSSAEPEPSEATPAPLPIDLSSRGGPGDCPPRPATASGTGPRSQRQGQGQGQREQKVAVPPARVAASPSVRGNIIQRSPHLSAVNYTQTAMTTAAAARSLSPSSRRRYWRQESEGDHSRFVVAGEAGGKGGRFFSSEDASQVIVADGGRGGVPLPSTAVNTLHGGDAGGEMEEESATWATGGREKIARRASFSSAVNSGDGGSGSLPSDSSGGGSGGNYGRPRASSFAPLFRAASSGSPPGEGDGSNTPVETGEGSSTAAASEGLRLDSRRAPEQRGQVEWPSISSAASEGLRQLDSGGAPGRRGQMDWPSISSAASEGLRQLDSRGAPEARGQMEWPSISSAASEGLRQLDSRGAPERRGQVEWPSISSAASEGLRQVGGALDSGGEGFAVMAPTRDDDSDKVTLGRRRGPVHWPSNSSAASEGSPQLGATLGNLGAPTVPEEEDGEEAIEGERGSVTWPSASSRKVLRQRGAPLKNRGDGSALGSGDRDVNVVATMAAATFDTSTSSLPLSLSPHQPSPRRQQQPFFSEGQQEEEGEEEERRPHKQNQRPGNQRLAHPFPASLDFDRGNAHPAASSWHQENDRHLQHRSSSMPLENRGEGSALGGAEGGVSVSATEHGGDAAVKGGAVAGGEEGVMVPPLPSPHHTPSAGDLGSPFNNSSFNNSTNASSIVSGSSEYYTGLRSFAALVGGGGGGGGGGSDFHLNGSALSSIPDESVVMLPQSSPQFPPLPPLGPGTPSSASPISGSSEYYARRRADNKQHVFPLAADELASVSPSASPSLRRGGEEEEENDARVAGAGAEAGAGAGGWVEVKPSSSSSHPQSRQKQQATPKTELTAASLALAGITATLKQPTALESSVLSFLGGHRRAATEDGRDGGGGDGLDGGGGRTRGRGFFRGESFSDDGIPPARSFGNERRWRAERGGAVANARDSAGGEATMFAPLSPVFSPIVREVRSVDRGRLGGLSRRQRRERQRRW
eukprot:g10402.t1